MTNKRKKDKFFSITVIGIAVIISGVLIIFTLFSNDAFYRTFMNYTSELQGDEVELMLKSLSDIETEADVVSVLSDLPQSGAKSWFVYGDKVIFEQNETLTAEVQGFAKAQLSEYFIKNGGVGLNAFFKLIDEKQDFSAMLIKNADYGTILATVRFANTKIGTLAVGLQTSESYLLSTSALYENLYKNIVTVSLLCIFLVTIVSWIAINRMKSKELTGVLESENIKNRQLIDQLSQKLYSFQNNSDYQHKDILTDLYNRDFLDAFVDKMADSSLTAGIFAVKTENLELINEAQGFAPGNSRLISVRDRMSQFADEKNILVKADSSTILLIKTGITPDEFEEILISLRRSIKELSLSTELNDGYIVDGVYKTEKMTFNECLLQVNVQ